jgi:hypothetical protein
MGHANVDMTLNVYTQVLDGALRAAVDKIGGELFTRRRGRASEPQATRATRRSEPASERACRGAGGAKPPGQVWRALQDSNLRPPGS